MGALLGMIVGGTLAMYIAGHLVAWIVRKISGVANIPSYAIGVSIMTFVGAWATTDDRGPSFLENWILYAIAAAIALSLMIFGDQRKQRRAA
jgi:hypothetical protein